MLTNHQASLVEQLVISGRYQNASEVLREGLRLIEQRETEDVSRMEALRSAVQDVRRAGLRMARVEVEEEAFAGN